MRITVTTAGANDVPFALNVSPDATLESVFHVLEERTGVPRQRQRLLHGTYFLKEDCSGASLESKGIGNNDTLTLVVSAPLIITGAGDCTAKLWVAKTGECVGTCEGHSDSVRSAVLSPSMDLVLTASDDGTAKLWNRACECIKTFRGHGAEVLSVAFMSSETTVLSASGDRTSKLWDASDGHCSRTLLGHNGKVVSVTCSPVDDLVVLTASLDGSAKTWSAVSGECIHTFRGHFDGVSNATFSLDGTLVLTASNDDTARIWNSQTAECIRTLRGYACESLNHINGVSYSIMNSAVFSADCRSVLTASADRTAKILCVETGRCLQTFCGHEGAVVSARFSADGSHVLTASNDGTVRLWSMSTGEFLSSLKGHRMVMHSVEVSR